MIEGQKLWQILAGILAKRSPTSEVIAYKALAIDKTRGAFKPPDFCAMTHELKRAMEESNLEIQNRRLRESVGQSTSDLDETAADPAHEASRAGPLTKSGHGWYPD